MRRRAPMLEPTEPVIGVRRAATTPHDIDPRPGSARFPAAADAGNRATARAIQAKLGTTNDPLERHADVAARRVVHGDSAAPGSGGRGTVQRSAAESASGGEAHRATAAAVAGARAGRGRPLPEGVRRQMERGFDTGFGSVRVHTDERAAALSASLGARAFTSGRDVFFGAGRYDPRSRRGKELIAHELTHTVQQGASGGQLQRSPETAAEELVKVNPKINSVKRNTIDDPRFLKKHELPFPATDETVASVRAALKAYREKNPAPAAAAPAPSFTGKMTSAEMKTVLSGNSGGQSYSPRGDTIPHWSVEWETGGKGVYPIKQVHYKVGEGKYFWWNKVSSGKATFSDSTMSQQEHSLLQAKVNHLKDTFGPKIHVKLDEVPALKPRG